MNINEKYLLNIVGCRAVNRVGWTDGRTEGQTGPDNKLPPKWTEDEIGIEMTIIMFDDLQITGSTYGRGLSIIGLCHPHKKFHKACAPILHLFTMLLCATIARVLLLIFSIHCAQADLSLRVSRPQHMGPLSIKGGENEPCRSAIQGANRCYLTEDCRGMLYYKSGTEKRCQTTTCPPGPAIGSVNQVLGDAQIFLLFSGTFTTGDCMLLALYPYLSCC